MPHLQIVHFLRLLSLVVVVLEAVVVGKLSPAVIAVVASNKEGGRGRLYRYRIYLCLFIAF